jgi:Tfp pilus assembly protein PilV
LISTVRNNRGITLIESMIAMLLTMIAILALAPMQDTSLRSVLRADYLGRAAGIMQSELELREYQVMSGYIPATIGASTIHQSVTVSGEAGVTGDATFVITTIIAESNPVTNPRSWIINVQVTWLSNSTGMKSSILATQQEGF